MSQEKGPYIPYGKQHICQEDIDAVVDVLTSDFLTQGPKVPLFEQLVAQHSQVKYACAANSATSALHIACLALGVTKGDVVWTSPISFVASSNCALYCGADVDFVDVESNTGLMSVKALSRKLAIAKQSNNLPKVVIPVHLAGHSCDMEAIDKLAKKYQFKIIEDASHGIGGQYKDRPIGNCQYCDISIFSFHPVKIITSAEGGMALTSDESLYNKMRLFVSHGVTRENLAPEHSNQAWYYEQQTLGFNYRMSELHAALGVNQLSKLIDFVARRNKLADSYLEKIAKDRVLSKELHSITPSNECYSAYHLFVIQLNKPEKRLTVFNQLRANGIGVNVHYIPICNQPYYRELGFKPSDFPNAQSYYESAITLPLHPSLSLQEQDKILKVIRESL
ncbi:UDP-4-amino-4,6-dideoxy-N-acetyl-beta-L-altrosamine transaminase [Thalassotalea sp. M1531]|uniref:UDP-4-amino-4, 6-dideoxy-N-acetyl-beta-L-altrosamine transaminase n=1 Tax=Thalassotalea algicola TaxID=2716224 RepID=A0A7Y0LE67_9GAMM|nr:UDP-4-amino-4,6-dideoxy-N-acetyl-beta-L-altrosamine transaminase [Thalassotalea algicola]NMP32904.1 UDP-4-amino-4,6-dideoxy-N-acetyl-beta-L-altrosamine transaminase [Thalassotalea algicola]